MAQNYLGCNLCLAPIPSSEALCRHLMEHYQQQIADINTIFQQLCSLQGGCHQSTINQSKRFKCTRCDFVSDKKSDAVRHGGTHIIENINCPSTTCNGSFNSVAGFLNHPCAKTPANVKVKEMANTLRERSEKQCVVDTQGTGVVSSYTRKKRKRSDKGTSASFKDVMNQPTELQHNSRGDYTGPGNFPPSEDPPQPANTHSQLAQPGYHHLTSIDQSASLQPLPEPAEAFRGGSVMDNATLFPRSGSSITPFLDAACNQVPGGRGGEPDMYPSDFYGLFNSTSTNQVHSPGVNSLHGFFNLATGPQLDDPANQ